MRRYLGFILWGLILFIPMNSNAQLRYKFRVLLSDKKENLPMLSHPETLLSQRAIDRRMRQHISIDEMDLPVSSVYLNSLTEAGYQIVCTSRWMNSVVVASSDSLASVALTKFPFVTQAQLVWIDNQVQKSFFVKIDELTKRKKSRSSSEEALLQLQIHHGDQLHQAGYRGENMWIAVIDAGFLNLDKIPQLYSRVLGTRDFVDPSGDIFSTHFHGTNVLSIMAAPESEMFSGTAPNAQYWLLRSEDSSSEYPIEEDYWVAAAEYADSLGVDVINSSLGYSLFDDSSMNHTYEEIDGKTTLITRGAGMAASKGILVVNSAGNERQNPWHRISFPSDHPAVLTVGSVSTSGLAPSSFSGVGFQKEGFVKPNVAAIGDPAYVIDIEGKLNSGSGTSYSTPVIAGLAACLWQALPQFTNQQIIRLLEANSSSYATPDSLSGFGIPDVYAAFQSSTFVDQVQEDAQIRFVCADSVSNLWRVEGLSCDIGSYILQVINTSGQVMEKYQFKSCPYFFNLNSLPSGLYIITLTGTSIQHSQHIYISTK